MVTNLEVDKSCGHTVVVGKVLGVESSGDDIDIDLKLPAGRSNLEIDTHGMNSADRIALVSTLLSVGNRIHVEIGVCGSGGFMYGREIRLASPREPDFPPPRKIPSGGNTFADLKKLVGKIYAESALRNRQVRRWLTLLGFRNIDLLTHYTLVGVPIELNGDDIMITGCAPHECYKTSLVVASMKTMRVYVAIFDGSVASVYSHEKNWDGLPMPIRAWLSEKSAPSQVVFR
ncbi:MAG: hypothetical protein ABIP75_02350 [Pyrinomonadaceae bacterium]